MTKTDLSTNQRKALSALLAEPTVAAAAEKCDLTERTLYRYLNDETFRRELRARQDAILSSVTSALVGLSGEAVQTLRDLLESKTATDAVKCRAALGWLKHTRDSVELADLSDRVAALEEKIGGAK
jgi:hypothetical protein